MQPKAKAKMSYAVHGMMWMQKTADMTYFRTNRHTSGKNAPDVSKFWC